MLLDVTSTLSKLIVDGIASHSSLLDSYVVLHAAFVSSLHKIIGLEFGKKRPSQKQSVLTLVIAAHFVQHVVSLYEKCYESTQSTQLGGRSLNAGEELETDTLGKECPNLIVLLSELYNFQVISSVLVFDIIRGLLENDLTELSIELLLKIVRSKSVFLCLVCWFGTRLIIIQDSGQQLRQDDPSALTDIIQIVQSKVTNKDRKSVV